jgi:hypothetical protein
MLRRPLEVNESTAIGLCLRFPRYALVTHFQPKTTQTSMIDNIKRTLAIVILICMFLPIAQCSSMQSVNDNRTLQPQRTEVLVPVEALKADGAESLPMIAIYVWPLVLVCARRYLRSPKTNAGGSALEVLLASGSLYVLIETVRAWGSVRYGGVIAIAAFAAYFFVSVLSLYRHLREPSRK